MIPVLIIALTFHEYSHAFIAYKLGDNTAKNKGRLTLNPLKHLDPLGTIMMIVARIGWAKPVPVNQMNFKDPKQDMIKVGLAGPVMNLLLAFITAFPIQVMVEYYSTKPLTQAAEIFFTFLVLFFTVNLYLAVFNLIPIPPLDGSRIFYGLLPDKYYFGVMKYERYVGLGMILLILVAPGILRTVLDTMVYPFREGFMIVARFIIGLFM
ncbi:MAG: site-2 protease family protein [Clostridia bacterium]|nr:site-2 protease family protein [Clostridia bacterium]MBN2881963.1 site-2 protease family protein [Clostridia bacterium]